MSEANTRPLTWRRRVGGFLFLWILILGAVPGARAETVNFFGPGSPMINYTGTPNDDQVNVSGFDPGDTITGAWNGAGGTNTLNWSGSGYFTGTIDNFHIFNKTGAGLLTINTILDLSGLGNGVTVISGGTLAFTAFNGLISQFITIQSGATLILNPGGGSDFQDMTVDRGGTVILNEAELWGDTLVVNGRLLADTWSILDLAGGVLVGPTGTLTATFVVSDLINFGTVVVPNNGLGMLVVGGYYNAVGATLEVPVWADGNHGFILVGDVVLLDGGTLRVIPQSGYYARGTRLLIMDVGFGITGTFDRVVNGLGSARLSFTADYANPLELWVVVNKVSFSSLAAPWTQPRRAVAGVLDVLEPGASADLRLVIGALDLLTADQLRAALGQLTPLVYDAFPRLGYDVAALFAASILDRLTQRRLNLGAGAWAGSRVAWAGSALPGYVSAVPGAGGRPATDQKFGLFVRTFGAFSRQDPAADRYGFDAETFGLTAGADWRVTRHLFLGLALGYAHAGVKLDDPAHSDGTLQSIALGLYGGWSAGPWRLDAALFAGHNSYTMNRRISFGDQSRTARADYPGLQFSALAAVGYDFDLGQGWTFGPAARIDYVRLTQDRFTETGAGAANLTVQEQSTESCRAGLGLRVGRVLSRPWGRLALSGGAMWVRELAADSRGIVAALEGGQALSFTVNTAPPDRDRLRLDLGLSVRTRAGLIVFCRVESDLGPDSRTYSGHVGVRYEF